MSDTIVSDTGAEPPFRAEHVGSLLRPAALLAARVAYEGGRITAGMLRETEATMRRQSFSIRKA